MALEYEVRPEFQSLSLSQLLDSKVNCFEGVGDTQSDVLERYFGITSVRQLGNMPFFLWALGIQEAALKGGTTGSQPVEELSRSEPLKFSVRPEELGHSASELLKAPVNVLDGLTPSQNMAMYDAFRITNVLQLAHNRIMLEARVIEYLEKHPELVESEEAADKAEIASILGADTVIPTSVEEARAMAAGEEEGELTEMAGELGDHLRGRIDALKDRAAERARNLSTREFSPSGADASEDILRSRSMPSGAGGSAQRVAELRQSATSNRMDSLSAARERTEATRVQTIAQQVDAARGGATPGSEGAPATAGTPPAGTEAAGPAAMDADAVGADAALGTEPSMSAAAPPEPTPAGGEAAAVDGIVVEEVEAPLVEGEAAPDYQTMDEPRPPTFRPWMAAAVLGLLILGGIIYALSPTPEPPVPPERMQVEQPLTPEPQPTEVAATTQPSAPPPPPAPPPALVHTVISGQSLWRISRRHYQNPLLWPTIYRANIDQIDDPDLIFPDQKFTIPDR